VRIGLPNDHDQPVAAEGLAINSDLIGNSAASVYYESLTFHWQQLIRPLRGPIP